MTIWQLYITKLAATVSTYRRILYQSMIPTQIFRQRPLTMLNSTMASAASPSPTSTKMISNSYPMAHTAS